MRYNNGKRIRTAVFLAFTGLFIAVFAIGCGGGGSSKLTNGTTSGTKGIVWKQVGATYVGTARCNDCHATIAAQYAQSDMGQPTSTSRMSGPNCESCHVTGYGDPSGFKPDGSTPNLDGIGCEDCHGPGSKHVAASTNADRIANITRTPPDTTCWSCHGDRIKNADGTYAPGEIFQPALQVTADTLQSLKPNGYNAPHHAAAAFLLGRGGYDIAQTMPSPHSTLPNTCLNCHDPKISPSTGEINHGDDSVLPPNLDYSRPQCASCHSGRDDSGTPLQQGILAMLIKIGGEDPNNPGEPDGQARGGLLGAYAAAHNIDVTSNANSTDPAVIAYKGARYDYSYVESDGSFGVHNPGFATKLLNDAIALLQ